METVEQGKILAREEAKCKGRPRLQSCRFSAENFPKEQRRASSTKGDFPKDERIFFTLRIAFAGYDAKVDFSDPTFACA